MTNPTLSPSAAKVRIDDILKQAGELKAEFERLTDAGGAPDSEVRKQAIDSVVARLQQLLKELEDVRASAGLN